MTLKKWDAVEFFSGCGSLSNEFRRSGLRTASLDILNWVHWQQVLREELKFPNNNPMDCNGNAGFALQSMALEVMPEGSLVGSRFKSEMRLMVRTVLTARRRSIFHFGVVCSSWVGICRASSGRSFYSPLGYEDLWWVQAGNIMMGRQVVTSPTGA